LPDVEIMETIQMVFRVKPEDMAYLKFIVESYEGLAVIRTVDPQEGVLEWMIPPDLVDEVNALIDSLQKEISILPVRSPNSKMRSRDFLARIIHEA
jgi:hypothetical protein